VAKRSSADRKFGGVKGVERKILDDAAALDLIVKGLGLGLCLIDKEKRILWVNGIFEGWFGSLEELGARHCHDVFGHSRGDCPAERVFETGRAHHSIESAVTKEGEKWLKLTAIGVKGKGGSVSHLLAMVEDVSEQEELKNKLQHTESVLRTIFEGVQAGLILIDAEGVVLNINKYMSDFFGLSPEYIVGKKCSAVFKNMPFLCNEYDSEKFKNLKEPLERQVKGRLSDGREIILEDFIHPAHNAEGGVFGFVELVVDVTAARDAEKKAFEAEKLKALRRVVGTVGHEINNPLQIILNLTGAVEGLMNDKRIRKVFIKNALRGELQSIRGKLDTIRAQAMKAGAIGKRLVESIEALPAEPERPGGAEAEKVISRRRKARTSILVVDDERDIRKFLAAQLKRKGYRVETAHSGKEALDYVRKGAYDIVIADIMMPEMGGCELYDRIKEYDNNIGVILMTGFAYDAKHSIARINEQCIRKGLPPLKPIYKPVKMRQLLNQIEAELAQKESK